MLFIFKLWLLKKPCDARSNNNNNNNNNGHNNNNNNNNNNKLTVVWGVVKDYSQGIPTLSVLKGDWINVK
ncbi:MAG: hypothetical protein N7Q72_06760, partial [Spiroplasma sp. Tabriz.8]|nr:hypothetical protein [Spiroplasma sp. Tabriz.8]